VFARISFDDDQKVTQDKHKELEDFLGDEIPVTKQVKTSDGEVADFWSYRHTYDPNDEELKKEDSNKQLVFDTNVVKLNNSKEYLAEVEAFIQKYPSIKIKIRGMVQLSSQTYVNMINQMQDIQDKFNRAISGFNEKVEFNQKCNVHIGNLGLLNINQLGYAVDKCTEELQEIINKGWRILAVCPQPDQRRPDYVLGRFNGNDEQTHVDCTQF
jgi:hypothetical protein